MFALRGNPLYCSIAGMGDASKGRCVVRILSMGSVGECGLRDALHALVGELWPDEGLTGGRECAIIKGTKCGVIHAVASL